MIDDIMRDDYTDYLATHIGAVKNAFSWICENLPELVEEYDVDVLGECIGKHDISKWDDEEFFAYCEYFYGNNKDAKETLEDFDYAWLRHQHNNPHHWQHWLLRQDDGDVKALEMPYLNVIEMVCDHWAFSWVKDDLYEIFEWYDNNASKMVLHENTKSLYESILEKIKNKLNS
jgi:hypothetical protein